MRIYLVLITTILFAFGGCGSSTKNSKQKVLDELRSLESVASAGIAYQDYSRRVLDTKIVVDRILKEMPQSKTKDDLVEIMECYVTAKNYWGYAIEHPKESEVVSDELKASCEKFDVILLPFSERLNAKAENVPIFWAWASQHIKTVETQQ